MLPPPILGQVFDIWAFVPIMAIAAFFGTIVFVIKYVFDYRTQMRRLESTGGAEYRRLAEQAVETQRHLLEETRRMNDVLREIERLLREV